jgi:hypothetical protein
LVLIRDHALTPTYSKAASRGVRAQFIIQLLRFEVGHKRVNQRTQLPVHRLRELMQRESNAMIRNAISCSIS